MLGRKDHPLQVLKINPPNTRAAAAHCNLPLEIINISGVQFVKYGGRKAGSVPRKPQLLTTASQATMLLVSKDCNHSSSFNPTFQS